MEFELRGVLVRHGESELRFSDWTMRAGENGWVHGRSGVGKSTLLKVLLGLVVPTRGQVRWIERSPEGESEFGVQQRQLSLGWVPQQPVFWQDSVAEVLRAPWNLSIRKGKPAPTEKVYFLELESLGLPTSAEFLARSPDSLSGGERMRLALARALTLQPQVLLLDEPTAGLDSTSVEKLSARLASWQAGKPGRMLVVASHDRAWMESLTRNHSIEFRDHPLG